MKYFTLFKYLILFIVFLFLNSCEPEPTCEDVICLNGGVCIDGFCDCPEGYIGERCEEEDLPISMQLNKITLLNFPTQNNSNENWDLSDNPDIYIKVSLNNTIIYKSDPIQNVEPSVSHIFLPSSIALYGVKNTFTIELFDFDDFSPDDFIYGLDFIPYTQGEGFPDELELMDSNIHYLMDIGYNFQQ